METTTFLYIGRRFNYPTAFEGALKLKEISYIHAEGYGAGEMKHGPIALVQEDYPTVAIATGGEVREKMISNIQEIKARGGPVIAIANTRDEETRELVDYVVEVPAVQEMLSPIINVIPLQLLAYHIAVKKGLNVDQPRNLAKSVTVE
jgi:glucosamine--fructose-6-phosphate aminotransferase (isomerizing)